uniref:Protein tyrosine phosphatase non-receptor type 23 n=1 Tax=Serinus canaria TaxID=9135 RepID=A0A8C9MQB3_SERCA
MEAVPRMPMIWLDLKEAGEFAFNAAVKKFVLKNYGENPESYNEELRKLEVLRQSAVSVPRDFEGCSTLRKYLGQLHFLQSRIPMGQGQEAAVPVTWTEIFSGKAVTHEDIKYEQACVLYNLGALHSMLGAMDKRVSEEGMKVSCTHFQCAAGAFTYLRDHFPHSYSVDMSHQILSLNINLMLGQAQECLLEKSMLDNRKSFLVARISAQVVDYYKEACRALENSETASLLGKIQKDWKKLVQMKIYYFAAVAHVSGGELGLGGSACAPIPPRDAPASSGAALAGQPETVQEALRFTMDVIGGKYNSAKKDNDFIYHEAVPALDTLQSVKGAPLVKALPVNPTDPVVTGPDIFAKLVPMAAHEASSLYSEEKAKLLRDVMAKIEAKNEVLDQFMDSMQLDPETVDNLDMYNHIPPVLMEKCAALSVRPDTVRNLVQSMQVLSGVFTDVEASLKEIRDLLEEDEAQERKLQELLGRVPPAPASPPGLAEVSKECSKYLELHEKASFTNTELHRAMNLHLGNLRLLGGPLEQVRAALPTPTLSEDDKQVLQNLKRILAKVQEMRDQRMSLEQQLREMIQKDDITTSLVTTDRSEMKKLFEEQLKKYDQLKVYLEQNLAAQENVLKALTDANVKYAAVRKALAEVEHKWNTTVQTLVASYEAYEDLMKKSQEGKDFYTDLEGKAAKLLERARAACQASEAHRQQLLERWVGTVWGTGGSPGGRRALGSCGWWSGGRGRRSIAIARCYSMKNRHQDIMPYDRNRVVLLSGKDDYINASRVEDLSPYCPALIATQAPLLGTAADFWLMIYEQKVSVVVMLVSEQELDKKVLRYFPSERGQPVAHGPLTVVLTSLRVTPTHVERMLTLQYRDQSLKRTVAHLQFTSWPELGSGILNSALLLVPELSEQVTAPCAVLPGCVTSCLPLLHPAHLYHPVTVFLLLITTILLLCPCSPSPPPCYCVPTHLHLCYCVLVPHVHLPVTVSPLLTPPSPLCPVPHLQLPIAPATRAGLVPAAAALALAAGRGAAAAEPGGAVRGREPREGPVPAAGAAVLLVHLPHQAAEVVARVLAAGAHGPQPRLGLGLGVLQEIGVDQGGEVGLVTEQGGLRRPQQPLQLVAALKGVLQPVLAVRAGIPALLVVEDAAAVPAQPGRRDKAEPLGCGLGAGGCGHGGTRAGPYLGLGMTVRQSPVCASHTRICPTRQQLTSSIPSLARHSMSCEGEGQAQLSGHHRGLWILSTAWCACRAAEMMDFVSKLAGLGTEGR